MTNSGMNDLISRAAVLEVIEAVKNLTWSQSGKVLCGKMYSQIKDIPAVYKAQEPRVMTLDEVVTAKPGTVVWLEDFNKPDVISGLLKRLFIYTKVIDFLIVKEEVNNEVTADLEVYGSGWRCWTSRPTDEQREAVKWE
jgi:hypothetical protein